MPTEDLILKLRMEDMGAKSTLDAVDKALAAVGNRMRMVAEETAFLLEMTAKQSDMFNKLSRAGLNQVQAINAVQAATAKAAAMVSNMTAEQQKGNAAAIEAVQHEKALATQTKATANAKLREAEATAQAVEAHETELLKLRKLAAAKKAQIALGASMAADVNRRTKMSKLHTQALKENVAFNKRLNNTLKAQKSTFASLNEKIFRYRMLYISLAIGIMIVKRALEATWEGLRTGAAINEQADALDRLAVQYNTTSNQIIMDLTRVSKSTLSIAEITRNAGKAMMMGIDPTNLTVLMEIAAASARITGETIQKSFADITLGTARASKKILDNIGIIVDWRSAYAEHAATLGITVNMLDAEEKSVARINAIKKAGIKIMSTLNTEYATQRERLDQFSVGWINFINKLKQSAVDAIFKPSAVEQAKRDLKELDRNVGTLQKTLESAGLFLLSFGTISTFKPLFRSLEKERKELLKIIKTEEDRIKTQTKAADITKQLNKITTEYSELLTAIEVKDPYTKHVENLEAINRLYTDISAEIATQRSEIKKTADTMDSSQLKNMVSNILQWEEQLVVLAGRQRKLNTEIEKERQRTVEKQLSALTKLNEKYIQDTAKAEIDVTKIKENELVGRLQDVDRYYAQQLAKINQTEAKALLKIEEGSDAALAIHKKAIEARGNLETARIAKEFEAEVESAKKIEALQKKSLEALGLSHKVFVEKQIQKNLDAFKIVGDMGQLSSADNVKALSAFLDTLDKQLEGIDLSTSLQFDEADLAQAQTELDAFRETLVEGAATTTRDFEILNGALIVTLQGQATNTKEFTQKILFNMQDWLFRWFGQTVDIAIKEAEARQQAAKTAAENMKVSITDYANFYITEEARITLKVEGEFDARSRSMNAYYDMAKARLTEIQNILTSINANRQTIPSMGITPVLDSFAHGIEFIPQTGPYLLHKGERVTPAEQNTNNNDNRQVTFNIYQQPGESTQELSDELTRALELPGDYY